MLFNLLIGHPVLFEVRRASIKFENILQKDKKYTLFGGYFKMEYFSKLIFEGPIYDPI